jgi:hypothetical protein
MYTAQQLEKLVFVLFVISSGSSYKFVKFNRIELSI